MHHALRAFQNDDIQLISFNLLQSVQELHYFLYRYLTERDARHIFASINFIYYFSINHIKRQFILIAVVIKNRVNVYMVSHTINFVFLGICTRALIIEHEHSFQKKILETAFIKIYVCRFRQ